LSVGQKLVLNYKMREVKEIIIEWIDKIKETKNYSYPENYFENFLRIRNNLEYERQYNIDELHVDYYFPSLNLVLEIDGKEWHNNPEQKTKDFKRDKLILSKGYTIFRVSANLIINNTDAVMGLFKYIPQNKCIKIESESDIVFLYKAIVLGNNRPVDKL